MPSWVNGSSSDKIAATLVQTRIYGKANGRTETAGQSRGQNYARGNRGSLG